MKLSEVIEKLQELNEEDFRINIEVEPEVNRYENVDGTGIETISYTYVITLQSFEKSRRYKRKGVTIEYLKDGD